MDLAPSAVARGAKYSEIDRRGQSGIVGWRQILVGPRIRTEGWRSRASPTPWHLVREFGPFGFPRDRRAPPRRSLLTPRTRLHRRSGRDLSGEPIWQQAPPTDFEHADQCRPSSLPRPDVSAF